jgi:hypothetical protein
MMSETMTVMPEATNLQQPAAAKTLPLMMLAIGFVLMFGSVVLAGRLIWEMTSLTWQYGPQMIGFSLAHGPGALLFLFPLALFVWLLASACTVIVWKAKRKVVPNRSWIALGSAVLALGLLSLPQGFWNVIFVGKMAASPRAPELLVYAAGEGEDRVVRGLLQRGVPIDARDREGNTPLHFAAGAGRTELVGYLIGKGTDVNAVNLYGDSPLERASANHRMDVVQVLSEHGGKDIKGDAEQRDRASKEIVHRDIEEMNSGRR